MKLRMAAKMLIIFGFFIPCVLFPFADSPLGPLDGYMGIKAKLTDYIVVLKVGKFVRGYGDAYQQISTGHWENRISIEYKYFIATGIVFIFAGIAGLAFSKKKII
ncbi:MAG: hypothetical protein A2Z08_06975 [Deltaproteobacteria bacterium RBG_16_54_11]|nr:MAG: hypothetical protein A2Z08_06975 [Deltaproteobacteria bacterium RBG_16_54_11]